MIWNTHIPKEEAERCLLCQEGPCTAACPHGLDPAGLLRSVRFQNIAGAAGRLPADNLCAGCPAPCEGACLRPDGPVRIRRLCTALHKEKEGMEALFLKEGKTLMEQYHVCHGDLDQHHLLMGDTYVAVTEFSRMHLGLQVEDLYHFLRKVMEKNDWDRALGRAMLEAYERVLPFGSLEKKCLYYLFLYPEKYWKQMNFYYNANKAWIPARNAEKLLGLKRQQEARMRFVNSLVN